MTGMTGTTVGTRAGTGGEAPDDEEELLDDELRPPPPEPVSKEPTDATEDAMAEARTAPKAVVVGIVVSRLSSPSKI